jgi:hypothetical protein
VNHIATLDHIIADFTVRSYLSVKYQSPTSNLLSCHKLAMTSNTYQTLVNVQGGIEEIQGDVKVGLSLILYGHNHLHMSLASAAAPGHKR